MGGEGGELGSELGEVEPAVEPAEDEAAETVGVVTDGGEAGGGVGADGVIDKGDVVDGGDTLQPMGEGLKLLASGGEMLGGNVERLGEGGHEAEILPKVEGTEWRVGREMVNP